MKCIVLWVAALGDVPKPTVQFAGRRAVGILATDRAPCRNVAGTPPGSDVRSWLGVRFKSPPLMTLDRARPPDTLDEVSLEVD